MWYWRRNRRPPPNIEENPRLYLMRLAHIHTHTPPRRRRRVCARALCTSGFVRNPCCVRIANSSASSATVSHYLGRATIRSRKRGIYGHGIKYCAVKHSRTVASGAVWVRISTGIAPGRINSALIASRCHVSTLSKAWPSRTRYKPVCVS